MYFTANFISLLLAVAASATPANAAVVAREDLEQLSVVFWADTSFRGAAYSPDTLVPGVCTNLPGNWLGRAESLQIVSGFACTFYNLQACIGKGTQLTGAVSVLPDPLYNNIDSFLCNKQI